MALYVTRNNTNQICKVQKYCISTDGEESIWSNEWYGRHVIGLDCTWHTKSHKKKLEILNSVFKTKDGCSWNELSEMLNELIADAFKTEYPAKRVHSCLQCGRELTHPESKGGFCSFYCAEKYTSDE